jgi:hypothetical protein
MSATITDAIFALTPTAHFTLSNPNDYSTCVWLSPDIQQPTQQQINDEIVALDAQAPFDACKKQASALLYATDWTTIPDVTSTANNPYLTNQADFIAYRNTVRKLAVTPVANPVFPPVPTAKWSS